MTREQAQKMLLMKQIKSSFWLYCNYMNYEFFKTRADQIKPMCDILEHGYNHGGKINIATPPRFGKSLLMNYFISWVFLQDKNNAVIRASYSQNLSTELNQGAREIMQEAKFRAIATQDFETVEDTKVKIRFKGCKRANLYASSVGGSTTGFGGNIIIGDDLYKDHSEALSDTVNNKTITWFHSAFKSRLDTRKQLVIMIGTRWTNKELVQQLNNKRYFDKVIKLKALVNNKSFNEEVITTERLLENKNIMHASIFESMYQQEPMEALDPVIDISEFKYTSDDRFDYRFALMDLADTGSDKTCVAIIDLLGDTLILRDVITDDRAWDIVEPRVDKLINNYMPTVFWLEENNNTIAVRRKAKQFNDNGINSMLFRTTKNKRTKILLNSGRIKNIRLIKTEDPEYNRFISNVCAYDLNQTSQHDDEIDTLAMIVENILLIKQKYQHNYR